MLHRGESRRPLWWCFDKLKFFLRMSSFDRLMTSASLDTFEQLVTSFGRMRMEHHERIEICTMKRQQTTLAVCLAHAAILVFASLAHAEGFLHTRGHDMVDEHGRKVLLRGVGLGNYLLPEGYMWKFGAAGDRPRKIEKMVSELIGQEDADRFWPEFRKNYITEADIQTHRGIGLQLGPSGLECAAVSHRGRQPSLRG